MRLNHIAWNLAGLSIPIFIAAATIPSLIRMIGMERFGLLSLAWGLIGFAGVFDLGIGRATTQFIAQLRGQNAYAEIPIVFRTAIQLTLITGTIGFLLLLLAAVLGVQTLLKHSVELEHELTLSVLILALTIPVQAISATYRGTNEAFENFRGINLLRIALGALNFLGPYLVAQYTNSLHWLIAILLISRLMALFVYRYLALHCMTSNCKNQSNTRPCMNSTQIKNQLFSFGGWITVSSVIGHMLVQADRFVIAGVISATAVATYTIPYDVVVQSLIIVGAISAVIFPTLSKLIHEKPDQWQALFNKWLAITAIIMSIVTIIIALSLPRILPLWIGSNLPSESIQIGQILCLGVFFNSIGAIYYALLHAQGRSDITAKLHIVELILFILALYMVVDSYGIYGVAWTWVGRSLFDTILLIKFTKIRGETL